MLYEKSKKLIPSCAQTFSKGYTQFSLGSSPIFLKKGKGCNIWDVDGNKYIDYLMALGPVLLGYNHPVVTEAVTNQIKKGVSFSLPHEKEVELAELLRKVIPCCEMARFGKNGSDATAGAVRAARAFTKRDVVACCGYHGWQDWYIGTTTRNAGVPAAVGKLTVPFEYNNIDSLKKIFEKHRSNVACIIMEPMGVIFPENNFLQQVKDLAKAEGALLIFDECWTGFRMALGGAQEYFGVVPDMACFGKAMGNGFSISAVVGKSKVMKIFDEIFFSFTFAGELTGITAAIAVIKYMQQNPVLKYIDKIGTQLFEGIQHAICKNKLSDFIKIKGYPSRNILEFKDKKNNDWLELKSLLQQEIHKRGILFGGFHAVSYSHKERDIIKTLEIYDEVFNYAKRQILRNKVKSSLKGAVVQPVFRKA